MEDCNATKMKISHFHLFVLMLGIFSCSLWGQDYPKKLLEEDDYKRWANVWAPIISQDGNWVSYSIDYPESTDTLVVMNPKKQVTYSIAGGSDGRFIPHKISRWFVFKKEQEGTGIMDLQEGTVLWEKQAYDYRISPSGEMIICIRYTPEKTKTLVLIDPVHGKVDTITGITDFSIGPQGTLLAYTLNTPDNAKIIVRDLHKKLFVTDQIGNHYYHNIIWNNQGTSIAFMDSPNDKTLERICSWELETDSFSVLNPVKHEKLKGLKILSNLFYFSQDGTALIFNITPIEKTLGFEEVNVQEWKGTDKWVYPRVKERWHWENEWWKTMWWPKKDNLLQLGNETTPQVELTSNQKYAVVYNQTQYEPEYSNRTLADLYAVDMENGKRHLIAKKQDCSLNFVQMSPSGNFLSYFKDKDWWIFDFRKHTNCNITQAIDSKFHSENFDHSADQGSYGNPGWTDGDNKILIYDEFDLWAIAPNGSEAERLTKGKEVNTVFRIDKNTIETSHANKSLMENYGFSVTTAPLLLQAYNRGIPFAYYKTDFNKNSQLVIAKSGKIGNLAKAGSANAVVYKTQSADQPPALIYFDDSLAAPIKIYQSNPQHSQYLVGQTERFNFLNSTEQKLSALLHYPDDYKEGMKYPMIVNIYERKSHNYANYINPTYYEDTGFNRRVYTANGYFVLEPDILYTRGATGISAVNCVTAAVEEVLDRHFVDKERIGLIGHSFGGYETAFIITQTKMFSAAVAGAAVTDLTSFYFSINNVNLKPDIWRFEKQQWRMGFSYFENKEAYLANSPLHQADKIGCPLLLWAGKEDGVIPYTQSVEFYLALRRLKKEVSFLLYPDEIHSLRKKENQQDLSVKILKWFDKHLK